MAGEAGTTLLVEIAKKVIQPVVDITVRHLGYLVHYKSNINNLKRRVDDLKSTRLDAENFWDSCANNNEETSYTSIEWMHKVKSAETAANGIKEAIEKPKTGCVGKCCPNPKQRYLLSKNAVKMVEEIKQLQIEGKDYVRSTKPALPPSKLTGALSNDCSTDFKTRSKIMDDIMESLKDDKISIIGVCGSGGVGKTTLMHELRERVKLNNLFHEVAMVTVSQNPDLSDIRCKLAEMLGLTGVKDMKNEIAAADEIRKRLTGKGRRTLVILDDIWNEINLEEIGIPVGNNPDCKVVLTSRQFGICTQMKVHTTIPVAVMPPEEAWYLFRKTAGDCVESDDLKEIAKKVVDECGGLPIALVTLAKGLSNKDIKVWKDAHNQLREHSVTRIPDMDKKVYSSIKMSYDFLASEQPEAMPLLFLCCQHPEDAAIKVENLARYCLALRLFNNVDTLEGVRNIVCSLIEHLKSCFLLEAMHVDDDLDSYEVVKMHDIIRDVGLKEGRDRLYMQIMDQDKDDIYKLGTCEAADYRNLKILVQSRVDGGLLNKSFLLQMEELTVLEYCPKDRYLPLPDFEGLTNLRMLSLEYAEPDEDTLSKIGRLTKLELLSFRHCFEFGPFPRQIENLSNLKLLDLRFYSTGSYQIPSGILLKLNKLEELYFGEYYFSGTLEDDEEGIEGESDQYIAQFEMLTNLKALQINLLDSMELLDLHFCFEKLQRFCFGTAGELYPFSRDERTLILKEVSIEWILEDKVESIVRRTEQLGLRGIDDWTDPLKIKKFVSLRELELRECEHLEYLISDVGGNSSVFTKLETLKFADMSGLTELCHNGNLPAGSLRKLRELYFHNLPKMCHLWVGPTDSLCLVNLTKVKFIECGALECIFPHSAAKCLVQLQILEVVNCQMLEGIVSNGEKEATYRGGEIKEEPTDIILHFPKLRTLIIYDSQNLRGFYNLDEDYDGSRVQPLFSPLVMLPSMEEFQVSGLDQLKQIVGGRIVAIPKFVASDWLQNLEDIYVESCASLESMFDFEGMAESAHVVTLGKLQEIYLKLLPSLTGIFRCKMQDISIPKLQAISVHSCQKLKNLVASNLIKLLQNLKKVVLKDCETLETVFDFEGLDVMGEDECAILNELQDIELENLPKLEHVCRLAPKEIHVFQNLINLTMDNCGSLAYLFSSSMAQMLEKLENLIIQNCESIKEGITMNSECYEKKIVFRSLRIITLENLKNLSSFCSSDQLEFEFPSLGKVSIIDCPEMKTFCYGHLTAEKLHSVEFASSDGKCEWKGDLNQTVQHFNASYKKENGVDEDDDEDGDDGNIEDVDDDEDDDADEDVDDSNEDADGSSDDAEDVLVVDEDETVTVNVSEDGDGDGDENAQCSNEVLDHSDTSSSSSTQPEQGTLPELITELFHPKASAKNTSHLTSSPSALKDTQESTNPSSAGSRKNESPSLTEDVLTTSTERPLHSSDTSMKTEPEKALSDSSSDPDDRKSSRILIHGVYVKSKMKATFEEILAANPNFLSTFRVKTDAVKTALVETAIHCLKILRQGILSSEQLVYAKNSLDDLADSGLDVAWLERGYQRANIVLDEEKVVLAEAKLAKLESEVTKDAFEAKEKMEAHQKAKEKLEASMALRDDFKTKLDALKKGLEERKELFGDGFDSK